jgi:hypothetical protein
MNPMIYPTRGGTRGNSSACRIGTLAAALTLAVGLSTRAAATVVVQNGPPTSLFFGFDQEISGAVAPDGATPWITATFVTDPAPNTVNLTLTAPDADAPPPLSGLTGDEWIDRVWFNLNPNLDVTKLSAVITSSTGVSFTVGLNGGYASIANYSPFEVLLTFANSGADRMTGGEEVAVTFTYNDPLVSFTALDFNYPASNQAGTNSILAAAHIQSTGLDDEGSGLIHPVNVIPEPGSSFAVILLLSSGLVLRSRRTRSA